MIGRCWISLFGIFGWGGKGNVGGRDLIEEKDDRLLTRGFFAR